MSQSTSKKSTNEELDLAKDNPNADAKMVAEARKLLRELEAMGISGSEYRLLLPFQRQYNLESNSRWAEER